MIPSYGRNQITDQEEITMSSVDHGHTIPEEIIDIVSQAVRKDFNVIYFTRDFFDNHPVGWVAKIYDKKFASEVTVSISSYPRSAPTYYSDGTSSHTYEGIRDFLHTRENAPVLSTECIDIDLPSLIATGIRNRWDIFIERNITKNNDPYYEFHDQTGNPVVTELYAIASQRGRSQGDHPDRPDKYTLTFYEDGEISAVTHGSDTDRTYEIDPIEVVSALSSISPSTLPTAYLDEKTYRIHS